MLHQVMAVAAVVILYTDTGLSRLIIGDVEGDTELRNIQLKTLNLKSLSFVDIVADHTHLVGKHDFSREVVVVGDLRKRIVFMPQGLVKILTSLVQELHYTLFPNSGAQC